MNILRWEPQVRKAVSIYGRRNFGTDKNDMRQNCFVALLRAYDKIRQIKKERGEEAAKGYVFVICKNHLLDSQKAMRDVHLVPYFDTGTATKPNQLQDALDCLKREDQELIFGLYQYGYTAKQLAQQTGTSRRWVQKRKEKIIRQLKGILCQ